MPWELISRAKRINWHTTNRCREQTDHPGSFACDIIRLLTLRTKSRILYRSTALCTHSLKIRACRWKTEETDSNLADLKRQIWITPAKVKTKRQRRKGLTQKSRAEFEIKKSIVGHNPKNLMNYPMKQIVRHSNKTWNTFKIVLWNGFEITGDTVKIPGHLSSHFKTRYWRHIRQQPPAAQTSESES